MINNFVIIVFSQISAMHIAADDDDDDDATKKSPAFGSDVPELLSAALHTLDESDEDASHNTKSDHKNSRESSWNFKSSEDKSKVQHHSSEFNNGRDHSGSHEIDKENLENLKHIQRHFKNGNFIIQNSHPHHSNSKEHHKKNDKVNFVLVQPQKVSLHVPSKYINNVRSGSSSAEKHFRNPAGNRRNPYRRISQFSYRPEFPRYNHQKIIRPIIHKTFVMRKPQKPQRPAITNIINVDSSKKEIRRSNERPPYRIKNPRKQFIVTKLQKENSHECNSHHARSNRRWYNNFFDLFDGSNSRNLYAHRRGPSYNLQNSKLSIILV